MWVFNFDEECRIKTLKKNNNVVNLKNDDYGLLGTKCSPIENEHSLFWQYLAKTKNLEKQGKGGLTDPLLCEESLKLEL